MWNHGDTSSAHYSVLDVQGNCAPMEVDADAIVAHPKHPLPALPLHLDADARGFLTAELECIANEILEHLPQLGGIGHYGGKRRIRDYGPTLPHAALEVREHVPQGCRTIGRLQGLTVRAEARICQMVPYECMHAGDA